MQCQIKAGPNDAAALVPFKKQAHGHGREKSLLYFGCVFSGWYSFGKVIKIVATRCHILELNAPNSISAGGPAHTPLGEVTAFPQTT